MTANWLQLFLSEAVRKNLCTQIYCTTCGAMEFRRGVLAALAEATDQRPRQSFDRETVVEVARALAAVEPPVNESSKFEEAVRCILIDLWSGIPLLDKDIERILSGSWCDDVLHRMQEHYEAKMAKRRAREEYEDPGNVQKRREEKKRLKQEQHQRRLAIKKERDRSWHEKHGKSSE